MQEERSRGLESIPEELRAINNWLVWRLKERNGKMVKMPYCARGGPGKTNDPSTWSSFAEAYAVLQKGLCSGVGFVFEGTPYAGVDLDHVIENGVVHLEAQRIVDELASYAELSQSGTGFHIIVKGHCPGTRRKSIKGSSIDVEVYGDGSPRYFAMTGNGGGAIREAQKELEAVYNRFMVPPPKEDALIKKMKKAKNGEDASRLWSGDISAYGGDESRADMALCNMLAFWTKKDAVRMDELFRQSGLYREKWDERRGQHTYGEKTIQEAIDKCDTVFGSSRTPPDAETEYCVEEGYWTCVPPGKAPFRMCNFTAQIKQEVLRDDGQEPRRELVIAGKLIEGKTLPEVTVQAAHFEKLNFVLDKWGAGAILEPGQAVRDRIRHATQTTSEDIERKTIYTHTGFRKVDGKLLYLYHGGAVGGGGVSVELPDALRHYALPDVWRPEDLRASLSMLDMFERSVSVSLLSFMYLAPLREFMHTTPNFTLFLRGRTNTGKSTVAALFMSHFGAFSKERFPANYADTANALRQKAFLIKDAPLWVDDYHPTNDPRTKSRMDDNAQTIARAYGDNATRGRMTSDSRMQDARPVRGLCISTGEDTPRVHDSGLARFFVVPLEVDSVPLSAEHEKATAFSDLQRNHKALGGAMRAYIEWLIPQADALPDMLEGMLYTHRTEAQQRLKGSYARQAESAAHLMVGYTMFARFLHALGIVSENEATDMLADAPFHLWDLIESQTREMIAERPAFMFLNALRACIRMNELSIPHLQNTFGDSVGYKDDENAYFNYAAVRNIVLQYYRKQGEVFPITSPHTLTKHLLEAGISPNTQRVKYIGGKAGRYLEIPLTILEGDVFYE